ncbi:ABC transporter permease [Pseudomonas sp. ADAK13]|uniref:ABC transporter permease n=1 Tax=Pseudomonas sp. ADAK13 TaxID=2730847 RepID=UPI0014643F2E|nr:ABC transporter permease [Pseudomonas sp. ADAK13]QJI37104.1 ABC transporter permease [Pseudomonas sp. ADAK13]
MQISLYSGTFNGLTRSFIPLARVPVILITVAALVFMLLRVLPLDPAAMLLSPNATHEQSTQMRRVLGLDRPIVVQLWLWVRNASHGDLGQSLQFDDSVSSHILHALPVTLQLVGCSLLLGIVLGVASGVLAFYSRNTPLRGALDLLNGLALAIPEYLWGIVLILVFGITLKMLPFYGQIDPQLQVPEHTGLLLFDCLLAGDGPALGSVFAHLLLPATALAMSIAPPLMRVLYSSLDQAFDQEYVRYGRLRGLSERRLLVHHALRNAWLPVVTLMGVQGGLLIGGTLLVESIFGLPGLGNLMIDAIASQDLPMIQGVALVYTMAVLLSNTCVELALVHLDPRLRPL